MTAGWRRNADEPPISPSPIRTLLAFGALLGAMLVLSGGPVAAQGEAADDAATAQDSAADDAATLRIVGQTTFVPADGTAELVVDVQTPGTERAAADGLVLSVTFYGRLTDEGQVDQPPTEAINRLPGIPLARAARTQAGQVRLTIPIRSGSIFDDRDRVLLREPGVYPVTVELRDDEGPLASVRTHLVRQPNETADEPPQAPVEVGVVLWVTSAEGLSPADATSLLTAHPGLPLTVVLDQGVVNQLGSDPETATALADALAGRPVLTMPTIDLDPSALAEIDYAELYLVAAEADRQALLDLGLQPAEAQTLLSAPLTRAGAEVLVDQGVRAVIDLDDRYVESGVLDLGSRDLEVVRFDRDLNRILRDQTVTGFGAGPQRANRVLARLTLRRDVDEHPVVLGGPAVGVDPAPTLSAFLAALSQPGAPRPVPLSEVRGGPPVRAAEQPEQDLAPVADLVDHLRQRLDTYASFHQGAGTVPDAYERRIVGALTRQRNPDDRLRALTLVSSQLDGDLGAIHIHQPQPVTMAARSASIPLVVENSASGPRRVELRFRGDRVISPDDGRRLVIPPGTSSIDIEVEARSLGVSPLDVTVWTPDGELALAETRFEIRSTAVPGLGLLVSLSAVGLLGLWWLLDHRRRRRAASGAPTDVPTDATPEPTPDAGALDLGETPAPRATSV